MIGLRLDPLVTAKVDAYAEKHHLHTRSDAVRVLLERALACEEKAS
jgi:metal-responsive CopG/Arc/MetJ family transcriptional regulator